VKVLVVGTGGSLTGSGITTAAEQMVRTLETMGHEPTRVVSGDRLRARPNCLNLENVLAVLSEAMTAGRAARANRADVVWLHTFGVPTLPALRALAQVLAVRAVRRPVIVQLHAFDLAGHVGRASILQRWVLRSLGRLSSRLVVLRAADAGALEACAPRADVAILPNWVEVPPEPRPPPPGPPYVAVFVGGLIERKGVRQLIDAMRLLDDVPVRLRIVGGAGDEGEEAAAALRSSAADLVATGRVEFLGPLDPAGVRDALRGAHLFVLPSRAEGMPFSLLEAMAEGRPVLVGDAGNMAEIVRETECGDVLSSTDPVVIAGGIRSAFADLHRLADQGGRGHRAAVDRFSRATAAQALSKTLHRGR